LNELKKNQLSHNHSLYKCPKVLRAFTISIMTVVKLKKVKKCRKHTQFFFLKHKTCGFHKHFH